MTLYNSWYNDTSCWVNTWSAMSTEENFDLVPGKLLGRNYKVLEFLGKGWEGEVYKVEEKATGIVRAIKMFYKHRAEGLPHIVYAKRLYQLKTCPIVIQYHHHDSAIIKKKPVDFLVSDFVDGEVLSQYIKKQPQKRLPPFEALHLFYALVHGIEQIHFIGEYHGDIHSDNIIVKRKGLGYDVHLIDLLHLGKSNKSRIQDDVFDLASILFEMIGGSKFYNKMPTHIKKIICGRKIHLIEKEFKNAGHLRLFIENFSWDK